MQIKSSLNIGSLIGIATAFGAVLPQIYLVFGTAGLVGAGVFVVCFLIQAFLPVGVSSSLESTALSVLPAVEGFDPAIKPLVDKIMAGIAAAQKAEVPMVVVAAAPVA